MDPNPGRLGVDERYLSSYDANYGAFCIGIKPPEVVEYYNKWTDYEIDLGPEVYKGPLYAAQFASKYLKDCKKKILDIGAGTGRVGYELSKLGFTNLHAVEPAEKLFVNSAYKTCYKSSSFLMLGPDSKTSLSDDQYDAVVTSGTFGEGHIPCAGLCEMIRIVRPGGYIIIVMREEYIDYVKEYTYRLEFYMRELEEVGKWKKMERTTLKDYFCGRDGVVFVYHVLEVGYKAFTSKVLALD